MPVHPCKWPTCTAYVTKPGYCPSHAHHDRNAKAAQQRRYDQTKRDPELRRFYNSKAWRTARAAKLRMTPVCERCQQVTAQHVHHRVKVKIATDAERYELQYLMSVCVACHNIIEAEQTCAVSK